MKTRKASVIDLYGSRTKVLRNARELLNNTARLIGIATGIGGPLMKGMPGLTCIRA
jgi:hypothetical protein